MAVKTTGSKGSDRLKTTVMKLRTKVLDARVPADGLALIDGKNAIRPIIRYPNGSSALRQYAAGARENASVSATRLKAPPAASPTAVTAPRRLPVPRAELPSVAAGGKAAVPRSMDAKAIGSVADLGAIVRRARRLRDMSQAELAALAGTGRRFVFDLEGGKPTIEFARTLAVCRVLGIDLLANDGNGE